MNRQRLDFESMRDTLLAVSGRLEHRLGGRPADVANDPQSRCRTVYGLVDRQSLPGWFRAFDFASPDQSVERRPRTMGPQQALFALNSPFVVEQARALAARTGTSSTTELEPRIVALFRAVFARDPAAEELAACRAFVVGSRGYCDAAFALGATGPGLAFVQRFDVRRLSRTGASRTSANRVAVAIHREVRRFVPGETDAR